MRSGFGKFKCGLVLASLLWGGGERALAVSASLPENIGAELATLGQAAGTIFVGQIIAIDRHPGFVAITFHVEKSVRGAAAEQVTLREWTGLWAPGQSRYTVGQRVLAFLHSTSSAGYSSPVHGAEGLVPVVVQGANAPQLLDIRRIAASVVRAPDTPLPTEAEAAVQLGAALDLVSGRISPEVALRPLPVRGAPPSTALQKLVAAPSTADGPTRPLLSRPVLREVSGAR